MGRPKLKIADSDATTTNGTLPKAFTFRPGPVLNVVVRRYLLKHSISFNDLCHAVLPDFIAQNPRWERRHLRIPRGKRPRIS